MTPGVGLPDPLPLVGRAGELDGLKELRLAGLTERETEVAILTARRLTNEDIGEQLGISPRTASTHLSKIYKKLGIGSRGELADLVREAGLLGA